jgi:hypothetical protein
MDNSEQEWAQHKPQQGRRGGWLAALYRRLDRSSWRDEGDDSRPSETQKCAARTSHPRVSILDPRFLYVPSHSTNIRETFDRFELTKALDRGSK